MKILSVRFKNLNSLRGEFEVNFENSPLADSGLFAITGPTGAGKTTLLDAITVALYNKVPRHGTAVEELMTRHTGECWSEVEFETNGKRYRSKWSVHRAGRKADGAIQADKMELSLTETGEILGGHRKTETLDLIEKVSGLDYGQFLRSVLLAQGEFSKFLKATAKERSELLEQMTDTFIFSRISQFIFEKTRDEKKKLDDFDLILGQFVSLSEEEVEEKVKAKDEAEHNLRELKKEEESARTKVSWFEQKKSLEEEQVRLTALKTGWQRDFELFEPALKKLNLHRKAKPYAHILQQLQLAENERETELKGKATCESSLALLVEKEQDALTQKLNGEKHLEKTLQEKLHRLPLIEEAIRLSGLLELKKDEALRIEEQKITINNRQQALSLDFQANTKQANASKEALSLVLTWLKQHESRKEMDAGESLLAGQLTRFKGLKDTGAKLQAEWNSLETQENQLAQSVDTLNEKVQEYAERVDRIEKELSNTGQAITILLGEKTRDQIQNELQELPRRIADVRELARLSGEYGSLQNEVEKKQGSVNELKEWLAVIKRDGEQTKELLAEAENYLAALNELLEKEKLLQKYGAHRHLLADGEPCPLCGALEHPFATHEPVLVLKERENACRLQQEKVNEWKVKIELQRDDFKEKSHQKQTAEKQVEQWVQQLQMLEEAFEKGVAALENPPTILETTSWQLLHQHLTGQLVDLQNTSRQLAPLLTQRQAQETALQNLKNEWVIEKNNLENTKESLVKNTERKTLVQQELEQGSKEETSLTGEIRAIISPFGLAWNGEQTEELTTLFRTFKNEYRANIDRAKSLEAETERLLVEERHITMQLNQLDKESATLITALKKIVSETEDLEKQVISLTGDLEPLVARKQLLDAEKQARDNEQSTREHWQKLSDERKELENRLRNLTEKISGLENRLYSHEKELNEALDNEGFASKEALAEALLSIDEENRLKTQEKQLDERDKELNALLSKNTMDLEGHLKSQPADSDENTLRVQLSVLQAKLEEGNRMVGAMVRELEEDAHRKQQHAAKMVEQKLQQQVYQRWQNLNALVGSADGTKFRNFAQGLTLGHLTSLANRHLTRFSPRYLLAKKAGDNLELEIKDAWQADVARPISTLSGGETFLVSLALALGLSDLASNKVQIESLFIDEGFGTLDAETLDVAMDALENLREAGKSIGIISHVEALKERITTQIQVQRLPGGYSSLSIKG